MNEKESCNKDSFAKLIREDPIADAHFINKDQLQNKQMPLRVFKENEDLIQIKEHQYSIERNVTES